MADIVQDKIDKIAEEHKGKKILVYGAGFFSEKVFKEYDLSKLNIVGISDKKFENSKEKCSFTTLPTFSPDKIKNLDFDCSLILLKNTNCVQPMFSDLHKEVCTLNEYWDMEYNGDSYIICHLGGSFKEYMLEHNMPKVIKNLKKGLDEKSIRIIDKSLNKILHIHDSKYNNVVKYTYAFADSFLDNEDRENIEKYTKNRANYEKKYKLTRNEYNPDVFLFRHGLDSASDKVKEYIKGKDFIDGGAFIGDSALALFDYNPNKIYSFEISKQTVEEYKKVMNMNNIPGDKYEVLNMGIDDKKKILKVNDNIDQGTNLFFGGTTNVECTDIDSIVKEKNINVGFIKADLEGLMVPALKGMKNTIRKYRPVLSLSIYHNPEEFFETKPLLEKITRFLNYQIEIQFQEIVPCRINETVIFAYPKELKK